MQTLTNSISITEANLKHKEDITFILKVFRHYAHEALLSSKQITRFVTGLSEIARNTIQYAERGAVHFFIFQHENSKFYFCAKITDKGKGIENIKEILSDETEHEGVGIISTSRLVDFFDISTSKEGTEVLLGEPLNNYQKVSDEDVKGWRKHILEEKNEAKSLVELLEAYETIREKENTLENTNRKLKKYVRQLQEKNNELKDFAHVVSHDLKSPLNVIFMASEMLSAYYKDDMGEEAEEIIEMMLSSAQNMKTLINDYLDYATASAQEDRGEKIDFNELVHDVASIISTPENVQIEIEDLHNVFFDKVALKQVVQNLLTNAIKYGDKPKTKIKLSTRVNDRFTVLKVSDNGPGIPKSHYEDVFRLYRTLGNKGQAKKGTGLGLPLIKRIAERNNGKVWLDSEIGEGTTFYFAIPHHN